MKRLILILTFLLTIHAAKADYESILLPQLIFQSTLIIRGTIEKVNKFTIEVKIKSTLKGVVLNNVIISKFADWTCAQRFDKYEIGQEEIFFLTKGTEFYQILGAGNEGEIPIIGDKAYYKQLYLKIDKKTNRI